MTDRRQRAGPGWECGAAWEPPTASKLSDPCPRWSPGRSSELELDSPSSSVNSKALMWGRKLTLGQYENKMYNKFSFYSIVVHIFHRCFELHLLHLDDERRAWNYCNLSSLSSLCWKCVGLVLWLVTDDHNSSSRCHGDFTPGDAGRWPVFWTSGQCLCDQMMMMMETNLWHCCCLKCLCRCNEVLIQFVIFSWQLRVVAARWPAASSLIFK